MLLGHQGPLPYTSLRKFGCQREHLFGKSREFSPPWAFPKDEVKIVRAPTVRALKQAPIARMNQAPLPDRLEEGLPFTTFGVNSPVDGKIKAL